MVLSIIVHLDSKRKNFKEKIICITFSNKFPRKKLKEKFQTKMKYIFLIID